MTIALTALAAQIESDVREMVTEGSTYETVWGYQLGYRQAMLKGGTLGDLEDQALGRHFEHLFVHVLRIHPYANDADRLNGH